MSSNEESEPEVIPTLDNLLATHSKSALSSWMETRGLPKSGRTKEILAKRVLRHLQGDSSSDTESSNDEDEVCHHNLPAIPDGEDVWDNVTQPSQIPNLREEDTSPTD